MLGETNFSALTWVGCSQNEFSLALLNGADYVTPLEKDLTSKGKAMQAYPLGAA